MIKEFLSEVNQGKSLALISAVAEISKQGKKVVFISTELPVQNIANRLSWFGATGNIKIVKPNHSSRFYFSKIIDFASEFDVIAIDAVDVLLKDRDYQKLDDACFGSFMNTCNELWVTRQLHRNSVANMTVGDIKKHEESGLFKVKQISRKATHSMFPGSNFLEIMDFETNEIKYYNLSNISKNK